MSIVVKCFATLAKYQPADPQNYPFVSSPGTVADLLQELNIPAEEVKIVFVNSKSAIPDTSIKDGDRVGLFPAVGGG